MSGTDRRAVERVRPPRLPFMVINKIVRWLLSSPRRSTRIGQHVMLVHLVGRRSGRRLDVPVAYRTLSDGRLLVLTNSGWRVNLRDRCRIEVTLQGIRRRAKATLIEDPDQVAATYWSLINEVGPAAARRRLGIRITVNRAPTHQEIAAAARHDGLALLYLDLA